MPELTLDSETPVAGKSTSSHKPKPGHSRKPTDLLQGARADTDAMGIQVVLTHMLLEARELDTHLVGVKSRPVNLAWVQARLSRLQRLQTELATYMESEVGTAAEVPGQAETSLEAQATDAVRGIPASC